MSKETAYYGFLPFIIIYFFFNNAALPEGLLYTTLLTPVFIYWLYKRKRLYSCLKWGLFLVIPIPFQLLAGPDLQSYTRSLALLVTAWIFFFTAIEVVRSIRESIGTVFQKVLAINSLLVILALLILPFQAVRECMWYSIPISHDIPGFPRLDLFAYEPSHYALLLSPVFVYFSLKLLIGQSRHPLLLMAGIGIPLLLSLSFGVIGALLLAFLIMVTLYYRRLPTFSRRRLLGMLATGFVVIVIALVIWPGNPVWMRVENIFSGTDTSARGRLFNSFMFAWDLALQHNILFGVGPGQVKILAHDLIINYYQYTGEFAEVVRIPNSMGEMIATFGLYGFVLKLFFEIYFFIRKRIYNNLFSFLLFIFLFIYQFTGSFTVNAAEIGLWAIIFAARPEIFEISKPTELKT